MSIDLPFGGSLWQYNSLLRIKRGMTAGFGTGPAAVSDELRRKLAAPLDEIAALVASPRSRLSKLWKDEVPETPGCSMG